MSTLAKIRAVHQSPAATADDLTSAAAVAREIAETADRDVAAYAERRPDLLSTAETEEIGRLDGISATNKINAEVARALAVKCDGRAAELREAAAELRRRERYDAAAARAAALPASIARDYAKLVSLGRSIVERIAQAGQAQAEANADLPKGLPPLPDVESFRNVPEIPKRIASAKLTHLYVGDNGSPLPYQDEVKLQENGMGWMREYLEHDERGMPLQPHTVKKLYRRWAFVDFETESAIPGRFPASFASELVIPRLRALDPTGWHCPDGTSPRKVLAELAAEASPPAPRPAPHRESRRLNLERFEREFGSFDALACNAGAERAEPVEPAPAATGLARLAGLAGLGKR